MARPFARFVAKVFLLATLSTAPACLSAGIRHAASGFEDDWNSHDAGRVAATYSNDATLHGDDGTTLKGRAEIENYFRSLFAKAPQARLELVDVSHEELPGGDLRIHSTWRIRDGSREEIVTSDSLVKDLPGEGRKVVESTWARGGGTMSSSGGTTCAKDADCQGDATCVEGRCKASR